MNDDKSFAINANTCSLMSNGKKDNTSILDSDSKFIIPIYQRPYSWTEANLKKFISDLFISFWGNDGESECEPMFIGTMQLSSKNIKNEQDVIDGQQRLTTFLVLLKVLKLKFQNCKELNEIKFDWLKTEVNSGKQQVFLSQFISSDSPIDSTNPYFNNASIVFDLVEEQISEEDNVLTSFDIDKFMKHLLTNIYFVVIETRAGLSKTLQIFNSINTTGLDLNGGDVFKIRMYEYLRDKKGADETAFNQISVLYQNIDEHNSELDEKVTDINGILEIYKYILIAKYELPTVLYDLGTDTFYERLFDTLLSINQWEHFKKNINNVELSIEDISKIIDIRYSWEKNAYNTCEDACAMDFIWRSRYSRYWILPLVFLFKFNDLESGWDKMQLFTRQLSKLYIIYSIRYLRAINDVRSFTFSLNKKIVDGTFDEVMDDLNQKIGTLDKHKGSNDFENTLTGDITYNQKLKRTICRLSAMLEEDYKTTDQKKISETRCNIFNSVIDIEHIESYKHQDESKREDIWNEWGENINSIGNLMILEQKINQSISNSSYDQKIPRYKKSCFSIVRSQPESYPTWDLEKCKKRKDEESQKILDYIFTFNV